MWESAPASQRKSAENSWNTWRRIAKTRSPLTRGDSGQKGPSQRAKAIVEATTHYADPEVLARVSRGLGEAMVGISTASLEPSQLLETRGW